MEKVIDLGFGVQIKQIVKYHINGDPYNDYEIINKEVKK